MPERPKRDHSRVLIYLIFMYVLGLFTLEDMFFALKLHCVTVSLINTNEYIHILHD